MSVIVLYDPNDTIVANKVTSFNPSANAPDFTAFTNKVVDPDLSLLWTAGGYLVPLEYWKYDGISDIVEMSAGEKDLIDADLAAKQKAANVRIIYEHDSAVNGSYSSETLLFSVPSGTGPHTKSFSYAFPIAILDLHFVAKAIHDGDELDVCVGNDSFLGPIAADITASDSTVDVPAAMAAYMKPGKKLVIDDSTNTETFDIISFDEVNNRVTVDGSYANAYTASTPTNVAVGSPLVRYLKLDQADALQALGEGKVGGSTVPANVNINIKYTNNEGSAKEFKATIEFLY